MDEVAISARAVTSVSSTTGCFSDTVPQDANLCMCGTTGLALQALPLQPPAKPLGHSSIQYIPGAAVAQLQVPDQSHTGSPPGVIGATPAMDLESHSQSQLHDWGGGRVWRLLQAIYTTAHLCHL